MPSTISTQTKMPSVPPEGLNGNRKAADRHEGGQEEECAEHCENDPEEDHVIDLPAPKRSLEPTPPLPFWNARSCPMGAH